MKPEDQFLSNFMPNFIKNPQISKGKTAYHKALHSELLTELSGRFPRRNEYFVISEVRIVRHFFEVFGKFGKMPKPSIFCHFWSDLNQKWQKLTIFGPIWTKFRSKQLKIWPGIHFCIDPINPIESIRSCRSNRSKKGWYKFTKMAKINHFWSDLDKI